MNILWELFKTFAKIGAFTFGGGYAMISVIDHECVAKKKWITGEEMMDIAVIAESTPGPVAINCATYTGYKMGKIKGALAATFGVVLPSFVVILLIAMFFRQVMDYEIVKNAFSGIRVAVSVLIIQAGVRMVKRMLKSQDKKVLKLLTVIPYFGVVLVLNILGIDFSTIYLIVIAGIFGFCFYGIHDKKEKK